MKILIRGAGDLATGIAAELWERGHQILMTDVAIPLTVRREVAFSRAVYEEHAVVEGIEAVLAENFEEAETIMACLLYTSPSPRDLSTSRMPSSA